MIDLLELRSTLTEALSGRIGTYTFVSTGGITPAIRVDDGAEPYEEEPKPSGLEVVIQQSPQVAIGFIMGGYTQSVSYAIVLKQWDINKTTIDEMLLVVEALNGFDTLAIGNPVRIPRQTRLDNIETMTIPVAETIAVYPS